MKAFIDEILAMFGLIIGLGLVIGLSYLAWSTIGFLVFPSWN